jgi:hypothetical protein
MQSLRAAVTILFAAAAFVLPAIASTSATAATTGGVTAHSAATSLPTSYAPDDTPWN